MASVTSRQGLIDYCLRRLGQPVVEINVDEDQLEERIDDAIEYFQEYHFDGVEKVYNKHIIKQSDIDNKFITVDNTVISVVRVLPVPSFDSFSGVQRLSSGCFAAFCGRALLVLRFASCLCSAYDGSRFLYGFCVVCVCRVCSEPFVFVF